MAGTCGVDVGRGHRPHPSAGRGAGASRASACGPTSPIRRRWRRGSRPTTTSALYLHNGNEYLEGLLGAAKARAAGVNVNYRYVAEELRYVLADSRAGRSIFHGAFAATLAEVLPDLPDGRAAAPGRRRLRRRRCCRGAVATRTPSPRPPPAAPAGLSPDDLYILYTGGTTGMPKGVLWRQADFLASASASPRHRRARRDRPRCGPGCAPCPAAPFMHGAAHWNAISAWTSGGTVVVQDDPARLDPADVLATCASGAGDARS